MKRSFLDDRVVLHPADCVDTLRTIADCSVDSCVTDPPYHLTSIVKRFGAENAAPAKVGKTGAYARASRGFMGQRWDGGDIAFRPAFWAEVLRVLKPGGHVVAFGGTRTYHRLASAIEDAGFDVRDAITWHYSTGFPKSHDVSKAIDKAAGATREFVGNGPYASKRPRADHESQGLVFADDAYVRPAGHSVTTPATDAACRWTGWGTALKPATEIISLARKPLSEGTVAANVLAHGCGALNVDGCRIEATDNVTFERGAGARSRENYRTGTCVGSQQPTSLGRWPANLLHDGSLEVLAGFPETTSGGAPSAGDRNGGVYGQFGMRSLTNHGASSGSAARFFYSPKADADDRLGSKHPTVKPVDLMRWLVRLVTPPGGLVLDPFAGTGTTGEAAWRESMRAILIEREAPYCDDIVRRMALCLAGPDERARATVKARHGDLPAGPLFDLLMEAAE